MPTQLPSLMGIQNLRARAAQGDPQAAQELQFVMEQLGGGGAGAPPGGAPGGAPAGPGMGAPPQAPGAVPPGQGQLSPQGGGAPIPAEVQARRANDLIKLLRKQASY